MIDVILRFLIGGVAISSFAMLGDVLRPKSFAGLFGAAPSIALASLGLTAAQHGRVYAAVEGRSMTLGALAFFFYAAAVSRLLMRRQHSAAKVTLTLLPVWFGISLGLARICFF